MAARPGNATLLATRTCRAAAAARSAAAPPGAITQRATSRRQQDWTPTPPPPGQHRFPSSRAGARAARERPSCSSIPPPSTVRSRPSTCRTASGRRAGITAGAHLVQHRPARRQPGAVRAHEREARKLRLFEILLRDRLQGDRGRLSVGIADRTSTSLRALIEEELDSRRRHAHGAHAGAGGPDRAHGREPARRAPRHRARLQRHRAGVAARSSSA